MKYYYAITLPWIIKTNKKWKAMSIQEICQ